MSQFNLPHCCAKCLAAEPTASWQIGTEEMRSEGNTMTSILHSVPIPLCAACHRQLRQKCVVYWIIGLLASGAVAALILQFGLPLVAQVKDVPIGVVGLGLLVFVCLTAWVTAWVLREKLVQERLAKYDPTQSRLAFGNTQYQELFNQANDALHATRRSFGV